MPRARKHIVCLADTPYYHVTARCVRRAFLCGDDPYSGKSYEHRRAWVEDRVRVLASLFWIDLCAYAVMSNHYHLIVKLRAEESLGVSDDEVLSRWTALFKGPLLVQRYGAGEALTAAEQETLRSLTRVYRKRLHSLSWFMKCLNEPIARKANTEDDCSGHFWEARFSSQALNSEKALITAMAYVDLNPVRAKISASPEQSDYTSVQARLLGDYKHKTLTGAVARMLETEELNHFETAVRPLMSFAHKSNSDMDNQPTIPMYRTEYLKLVDATGRCVISGKRGRIDPALHPILQRLRMSEEQWTMAATAFSDHYRNGDLRLKKSA